MNCFRSSAILCAALIAIGIAACGGGDSSGPPQAGPATSLTVVSGGTQDGQSGEPLAAPLTVKATDRNGNAVARAVVTFIITSGGGTLSATVDTTDSGGMASVTWTMGSSLGAARVEARVTGVVVPAVFNATVGAGPASVIEQASPSVGNSAAGFDVIDSVAVRVTDRFSHPIPNVQVTFAVTAGGGTVSHTSKTTGDDGIARAAWRLGTGGAQALLATAGAFNVTLTGNAVTCTERQMSVGEVVSVTPGSPTCVVMNGTAQRFVVTVANSTGNATSSASFRFRGAGAGPSSIVTQQLAQPVRIQAAAYAAAVTEAQEQHRAHSEVMRVNTELLDRLAAPRHAQLRQLRAARQFAVQAPPPNVGDVIPIRLRTSFNSTCSLTGTVPTGGRVVYVGTRSIIVEDTTPSPRRGEVDAVYEAVGQEFDNVMWPILTANFGDPLAMDAQLDNNGRIIMVFSPHVNAIQNGTIAGFVLGGDFFPTANAPTICPASNVGEYFYARVPNEVGSGFTSGNGMVTPEEWLRETRTVIIHESKHIASYAEKFASPEILPADFFGRDLWLEEATAMTAEELWARTIFGYTFRGNVDYQSSIFCEVRPTNATCQPTKPVSMFDHYFWLEQFARDPELKSPIASPSVDFSVYGSAWLFVRYLLDQYAATEGVMLGAMTRETQQPGVLNVEARTGKSFNDVIADWGAAFALDDYPGFTPADPKHKILSWNVRDIYSRLNADFSNQGIFLQQFPLKVRAASFGQFLVDVDVLRGGGMSVFEVSGVQTAKQLFEFKGPAGTEFPAELRINIARVQ